MKSNFCDKKLHFDVFSLDREEPHRRRNPCWARRHLMFAQSAEGEPARALRTKLSVESGWVLLFDASPSSPNIGPQDGDFLFIPQFGQQELIRNPPLKPTDFPLQIQ
jgi:hypothetical protein